MSTCQLLIVITVITIIYTYAYITVTETLSVLPSGRTEIVKAINNLKFY